ncbi:MAG: hypothetical protein FD187_3039 [bacterium]|nr:MAG: hypothetical protein FD142_3013 [bacterium]KAF0147138.1 MAG: hypothetical protein FD187_3039 [bacterium]KAF0165113.1 MAG: hypothetical protein FD158_2964 [bacterium]TXT22835.1 MAG: hypothetical protein FD132_213 [bacterium]
MKRFADFLLERSPQAAKEASEILLDGLAIFERHPLIGRVVEAGYRELVISRGRGGYRFISLRCHPMTGPSSSP